VYNLSVHLHSEILRYFSLGLFPPRRCSGSNDCNFNCSILVTTRHSLHSLLLSLSWNE